MRNGKSALQPQQEWNGCSENDNSLHNSCAILVLEVMLHLGI